MNADRAMNMSARDAWAWRLAGGRALDGGDVHLAAICFERGLAIQEGRVDVQLSLGRTLMRMGNYERASRTFRRALQLDPSNVDACRYLITALEVLHQHEEVVGVWLALGRALAARQEWDGAVAAFEQALRNRPTCLAALLFAGRAHLEAAAPGKAIDYLERAVTLDGNNPSIHSALARAHHLVGNAVRGAREFVFAARLFHTSTRSFEQPMIDSCPLGGKVVLLWADQELGDTIQYARYFSHARRLGARVIVECHRILVPILERLDEIERVVARGEPLPAFDLHGPLTMLPGVLAPLDPIAACETPYLTVDPSLVSAWRQRLGIFDGISVGIVWTGAPHHNNARTRFTSLTDFGPLAGLSRVRFISLQLSGPADAHISNTQGLRVEHVLSESASILDTAALILNLDLVISVDTMVVHLTGALARPVWTLLPYAASWPWLAEGNSTPWYSTMRLFRQNRPGVWRSVLAHVRDELDQFSRHRRAPLVGPPPSLAHDQECPR
jgi:Flp pilus assembly protein TadD